MHNIGPDNLFTLLAALGDRLAGTVDAPIHLIVIGGSGLLAIDAVDRATRDVDVVAIAEGDALVSAKPLPKALVDAAAIVARDFGLAPDWLNAGPTSLLEIGGLPSGFRSRLTERQFGTKLKISFAARIDQIHFKVYAAADRGEPRDLSDLRALEPTPDELHAAASWARTHNMPGPFDDALAHALRTFGVEDAGRNP